jgi:hypothetical protein
VHKLERNVIWGTREGTERQRRALLERQGQREKRGIASLLASVFQGRKKGRELELASEAVRWGRGANGVLVLVSGLAKRGEGCSKILPNYFQYFGIGSPLHLQALATKMAL